MLEAHLVPVDASLVVDEDGKSMLRAREGIIFSPALSIAIAPVFNTQLEFMKKCGLTSKKYCRASLSIPNNIYKAGDVAVFNLQIDNSKIKYPCHMIVHQQVYIHQNNYGAHWFENVRSQKYEMIAAPKESAKDLTLQFPVTGDWKKSVADIHKALLPKNELFHLHYEKLPESNLAS